MAAVDSSAMAAVAAARAQAASAEMNARNSSSRLGADIASLREELRKVSNYRRAVAAELSEMPAASSVGANGQRERGLRVDGFSAAASIASSDAQFAAASAAPSGVLSAAPSVAPSVAPSIAMSAVPAVVPSISLFASPSAPPSDALSFEPSVMPSLAPSAVPSAALSVSPSAMPSAAPSGAPSAARSRRTSHVGITVSSAQEVREVLALKAALCGTKNGNAPDGGCGNSLPQLTKGSNNGSPADPISRTQSRSTIVEFLSPSGKAVSDGSPSPQRVRRRGRRCRSILPDDSEDEQVVNQRRYDELQDKAEDERRRSEMEQVQQEIAALQRECAAKAERAAAARAELAQSEEGCVQVKSALLGRLATFDGVVAAIRGQPYADRAEHGGTYNVHERGSQGPQAQCWRSFLQQQGQEWPVHENWDFRELAREIRTRLVDSNAVFAEFEELQERGSALRRRHDELEDRVAEERSALQELVACARGDQQRLRQLTGARQQAVQQLREQLRSEEAACSSASARLAADRDQIVRFVDSAELEAFSWEARAQVLAEEAHELAGRVAAETSDLQRAASLVPRRDMLLQELEQRDAASWDLNAQLVSVWREEEAATARIDVESRTEAELREQLKVERDAAVAVQTEEDVFRAEAAKILEQISASKAIAGPPPIAVAHTGDLSSFSMGHLATFEPVAREVEELEAEMHALSRDEMHVSHSEVTSELEAMRAALREENAQWRLEMTSAREAALMRNAMSPDDRGIRDRAPTPSPSGLQLALRAWDEILGGDVEEAQEFSSMRNAMSPDSRVIRDRTLTTPSSGVQLALRAWDEILGD